MVRPGEIRPLNLIDGDFRPAEGNLTFMRASPAGGAVCWKVPRSSPADLDAAVLAAGRAQPGWAATSAVERGKVLRQAAEALRRRSGELVEAVCAETGKPRRDSLAECDGAIEMAHFVSGEGRRLYGRTTTSANPHKRVSFVRSPIGVAGLIAASNTPLPNYAWKVFPALICGNAAILKPSEDTPASAQLFAEVMIEAGTPRGVLGVVHGEGPVVGAAIAAHPRVDVVSFTGSVATGRAVAATAGGRLAKVCLELGGKNPMVVCDDADLDGAVEAAALSAFSNAGQRCAAGSRMIVFDAVYEQFRERLTCRAEALKVGADDGSDVGPVINSRQLEHMMAAVAEARAEGAKVVTGGRRLVGPPYDSGCFMAPTLLEDVAPESSISQTELFGPISILYRVESFDEAVEFAANTPFGLTAAIWTANIDRAAAFAERVQAGMIVVNGPTFGSEPHMPFGGFRQSGNGFREAGTEALDVYSDWKTISVFHDPTRV